MKLYVYVVEARGLKPAASVGAYVKLRAGKHKSRTRTIRGTVDPVWNDEFVFPVDDFEGGSDDESSVELKIDVFGEDGGRGKHLGRAKLTVDDVADVDADTMPAATWFALESKHRKRSKSKKKERGSISLLVTLYGSSHNNSVRDASSHWPSLTNGADHEQLDSVGGSGSPSSDSSTVRNEKYFAKALEETSPNQALDRSSHRVVNKSKKASLVESENCEPAEVVDPLSCVNCDKDDDSSERAFKEAMEQMQTRKDDNMPENLRGGILLEQTYMIAPKDLNSILFGPKSQFRRELAEVQESEDYQETQWTWKSGDQQILARSATYGKAASKLVKAFKATEEHIYLKADGKNFAVINRVSTPDVPYGDCFQPILLSKITPGPQLSSGEESARLVISWEIEFQKSTIMKSIIEGSARQGMKESYVIFVELLSKYTSPVDLSAMVLDKEQLLAPLQLDYRSDWQLAVKYFFKISVLSTILMVLCVIVHIVLSRPAPVQGLEFAGFDLPDSFMELITGGIIVLSAERVFVMIKEFIRARVKRGSDHGVKAQGDGWIVTVALIEGCNLPSAAANGFSGPYVVFNCHGKTRTSSIQLQTSDPQWNEILEFDAMQEPPSLLDVEVFDFDGPFNLDISLGHAEVNFLRHTAEELADLWVPLEGKLVQTSDNKLHLRIFVDNTKGVEAIKEYVEKMEKEVGKKLSLPSAQKNDRFQRLFELPSAEFLINDFSCYLMKKIPTQGRIYLSARVVGFHANFFGHKIKFFFLWEDVEDIQVLPSSLATVGSPAILIILKANRGLDARHGAKSLDAEGRLKYQFQAFGSFEKASRTIMALWKSKTTSSGCSIKFKEENLVENPQLVNSEDVESSLISEDSNLSKSYTLVLPIDVNSLMEIFDGGHLEYKLMAKVGLLSYTATMWKETKLGICERGVHYKLNHRMFIFGVEVISHQRRMPIVDGHGWIINEVMGIQNIPFGDHFQVHVTYNLESFMADSPTCQCVVSVGIEWIKSTKLRKRITKNICDKLIHRSKEILELAVSLMTQNGQGE